MFPVECFKRVSQANETNVLLYAILTHWSNVDPLNLLIPLNPPITTWSGKKKIANKRKCAFMGDLDPIGANEDLLNPKSAESARHDMVRKRINI